MSVSRNVVEYVVLTVFSLDFEKLLIESSRSKLGVRLIFRVSTPSSLKKESVFRTVPFLDLLAVPSSVRSKPSSLVLLSSLDEICSRVRSWDSRSVKSFPLFRPLIWTSRVASGSTTAAPSMPFLDCS